MPILDQQTHSQISDLSEACGRYWELRGIAKHSRKEMQLELEHHFIQAAMDGKPPETVVGRHPVAFAEAWAREMRPHVLRTGALLLPGMFYALSVVSTTALVQQMFARSSSFAFTLLAAYLLIGSGLGALLFPLGGFLAVRIRSRAERTILWGTMLVLGAFVARSVGMRVNWRTVLLSWSWPLTLLLVALAVVSFCLECWRRALQEDTSARQRVKPGRSFLLLAGDVILFDLILGISSIVVFNVCLLTGRVF